MSWQDVNLYRRGEKEAKQIPWHNASSYDPNASFGGEMDKYWEVSQEKLILVKRAYRNYGQQSINEAFATELHMRQKRNIPFVAYDVKTADDNAILACCEAFTTEDTEFVSAYEVLHSTKRRANRSAYEQYFSAILR